MIQSDYGLTFDENKFLSTLTVGSSAIGEIGGGTRPASTYSGNLVNRSGGASQYMNASMNNALVQDALTDTFFANHFTNAKNLSDQMKAVFQGLPDGPLDQAIVISVNLDTFQKQAQVGESIILNIDFSGGIFQFNQTIAIKKAKPNSNDNWESATCL